MRVFLMVIDGFGIGEMPDAALFGDEGSDTYGHVVAATQIRLPHLAALGLNNICGIGPAAAQFRVPAPNAAYGRMSEKTFAKDTTAGHYELAGLVMQKPFRVFPNGFPEDIVRDLEKATGVQFMGNEAASGTEIIQRLGEEHLRTGKIILYTSQDSVMQIASDTSVLPLTKLYDVCEAARAVMTGERTVGRVIARPFSTTNAAISGAPKTGRTIPSNRPGRRCWTGWPPQASPSSAWARSAISSASGAFRAASIRAAIPRGSTCSHG